MSTEVLRQPVPSSPKGALAGQLQQGGTEKKKKRRTRGGKQKGGGVSEGQSESQGRVEGGIEDGVAGSRVDDDKPNCTTVGVDVAGLAAGTRDSEKDDKADGEGEQKQPKKRKRGRGKKDGNVDGAGGELEAESQVTGEKGEERQAASNGKADTTDAEARNAIHVPNGTPTEDGGRTKEAKKKKTRSRGKKRKAEEMGDNTAGKTRDDKRDDDPDISRADDARNAQVSDGQRVKSEGTRQREELEDKEEEGALDKEGGSGKKRKRRRRGKKEEGMEGKKEEEMPSPEQDESLGEGAKKALFYTHQYLTSREEWKFNKAKQNFLLKNILNSAVIPETYVAGVIEYLASIKGGSREHLLTTCKDVLTEAESAEQPNEDAVVSSVTASTPASGVDHPQGKKITSEPAESTTTNSGVRLAEQADAVMAEAESHPAGDAVQRKRRAALVIEALGSSNSGK